MKLILLLLISFNVLAWEETSFSEDSDYQYWTGVSSPRDTLQDALTEAYDNALNEAVKYNYGFNQKITESSFQNLNDRNLYKENHVETPTVQFKDVLPLKQKTETTKNGKFVVHRQLRYSKKAIEEERNRISNLKPQQKEMDDFNLVSESNQGNKLGVISISTYPNNSEIKLTPIEKVKGNQEFYLSSNNTEFIVPLGAYKLDIVKSGYKLVTREIVVAGKNQDFKIVLEPADSWLDLQVFPQDSSVFINDIKITNLENIKVKPNETLNIRINHPDYHTESFSTSVLTSDHKIIRKELKPKKSAFRIISTPAHAKVFANGKEIGETPILNFDSQDNSIEFVVVKKGFKPYTKILHNIKANSVIDPIEVTLESSKK